MVVKKGIYVLALCLLFVACKRNKSSSTTSSKERTNKESSNSSKKSRNEDTKLAETIVKEARKYSGTPYKYGGTSRAGMDCSGLMCNSYKAGGIVLPRTSTAQSTFGKTVSLSQLQVGDLVFFTDRKGNKKITHVGMVTEVKDADNVKFIHASTKLGVVETDLFSNYYKPLIVKAVRIL